MYIEAFIVILLYVYTGIPVAGFRRKDEAQKTGRFFYLKFFFLTI